MTKTLNNDSRSIDRIIETLGDLPSAPAILSRAIKMTSDIDSSITDISRHISADQSITAKVVRMSNSPIFARLKRVSSLEEAIKVLGFSQLKSIIITATTFQMFEDCTHAKLATDLWHHSFCTAIGSRMIAERLTTLDKEEAYLAGLLHDVGKLILLKTTPQTYAALINTIKSSGSPFVIEEQKELGFDHTDIGTALLEKWRFPKPILDAVEDHHKCNLAHPANSEQLARVVALADSVSRYLGIGFYEPYENNIDEEFYLGPSAIEGEQLIMTQCDVESQFNSELSLLC